MQVNYDRRFVGGFCSFGLRGLVAGVTNQVTRCHLGKICWIQVRKWPSKPSLMIRHVQFLAVVLCCSTLFSRTFCQTHPILISPSHLSALQGNNAEWKTINTFCKNNLNTLIDPGYAGFDWKEALVNYATAYQVLKTSDAVNAEKYAKKALALMKVMARHHNYGGPQNGNGSYYYSYQFVGFADGTTTQFTLPGTPLVGTTVQAALTPLGVTHKTYAGTKVALDNFEPILKISNTSTGSADYAPGSYKLAYRDGLDIFILIWPGSTHPAANADYYITQSTGAANVLASTQYTVSGNQITFTAAPAANQAVFVKMIDTDYNQTGNLMGGVSSVQPDGPGYPMRTFNPGLAYGIDLLFNYSGLTADLKTEFVGVLNEQLTWYNGYGYERDGDIGNYFIEGLVNATMYTGYGTDGINPSAAKYKADAAAYLNTRILPKLKSNIPGGYGPQGQYTNGVFTDIITIMSLYKEITGTDLLAQTSWTGNMITASIHGTKPDHKTFYDGGDWTDLPATPMTGMIATFLTYLPDHAMAPYARQYLKDLKYSPAPVGATKDYKTDFPLSYLAETSGPVYARSSWATDAVWVSFAAGELFFDHQHRDQGHITIQRGTDYLLIDGGEYDDTQTVFHNTLLFDDRGAGNISVYPPGQGYWGDKVKITRYQPSFNYVFSEADITTAYESNVNTNSVTSAIRAALYIRPGIVVVHDKTKTKNANVKKIFNLNFPVPPVKLQDIYSVTVKNSKLFVKALVPSNPAATITPITLGTPMPNYRNYQVTKTGSLTDNFFYVFEATAKTQTVMSNVSYTGNDSYELANVLVADTVWTAVFAKQGNFGQNALTYTITADAPGKHHDIVSDLSARGEYKVTVTSGGQKVVNGATRYTSKDGILSLVYHMPAEGTVLLEYRGAAPANPDPEPDPEPDPDPVPTGVSDDNGNTPAVVWVDAARVLNASFTLNRPQSVNARLLDVSGRALINETRAFGTGQQTWSLNGSASLKPGVYIVQLNGTRARFKTTKVILK